jgi:hypothetical protein
MKKLYKMAVKSVQRVYKINTDLGTVEFHIETAMYGGRMIQVLSIAGSNEALDWLKNINLLSWKGIKLVGYRAAKKIYESKVFKQIRNPTLPLLVACHTKSGPTGVAFKRIYGCEWLVAFAPAPSLRRWVDRKMENTTIFIDPDDIVHKAGIINFGQPECKVIKGVDDHTGIYIKDHFIEHWVEYVDNMDN